MMNLSNELKERGMRLADLARAANVDPATATRWAQRRIPAERVLSIEALTGIPRTRLRPDLYPED